MTIADVVNAQPLIDEAFKFAQAIVLTCAPIVVTWFLGRYLHISATNALAQRVITAASNGAAYALSQAQGVVDKHAVFDVNNPLVATAAGYVARSVSAENLSTLGVTPARVSEIVAAQLQKQLGAPVAPDPPLVVNIPPAQPPAALGVVA